MLDVTSIVLIIGAVLPFLVDVVIRIFGVQDKDNAQKLIVTVLSILGAVAIEFGAGLKWNWNDAIGMFALIFGTSQVIFRNFYKDTLASRFLLGQTVLTTKTTVKA